MRRRLTILFLVLTLVGCVTATEIRNMSKMNKFSPTAESYAKSIQWSDFETAIFFAKHPETKPDLDQLENVKVTSYEVKKITHQKEQLKVLQAVELSYYMKNQLREKTIRYQEVWEYDERDGAWYITSGFPIFE